MVKINWRNFKIFFSWTIEPISTKLGTKHPSVKGIQFYSNKGPCPFPRGDNCEIAKIHWRNLKIFFSRTAGPILTKFGTKHPWVKGIQVFSNEESFNFHKVNNGTFSSLNQHYDNHMCLWFELFSKVNDMAHGPLVNFFRVSSPRCLLHHISFSWSLTDHPRQIMRFQLKCTSLCRKCEI